MLPLKSFHEKFMKRFSIGVALNLLLTFGALGAKDFVLEDFRQDEENHEHPTRLLITMVEHSAELKKC